MKNKFISKHFRFTAEDDAELKKKAKAACISEAALVRMLIHGYEPKSKPDGFNECVHQLAKLGANVGQLLAKANSLNFIDTPTLISLNNSIQTLISDMTEVYINPERVNKDGSNKTMGG